MGEMLALIIVSPFAFLVICYKLYKENKIPCMNNYNNQVLPT